MKKIKIKLSSGLLMLALLTFTGCSAFTGDKTSDGSTAQQQQSSDTQKPSETEVQQSETEADPIAEQIENMTIEEKIGQMVIVGLEGYEPDENAEAMIRDYHVGGFILFRNNVKSSGQLLTLLNTLKQENTVNKVPLFLSVDEEGGRIDRMPEDISKLPSNMDIGKINNGDFSYKIGGLLAQQIKAFGFNMDFAPVLDIFSNPKNTVIGDRSFGTGADVVSKLGIQTMKGIREGGIIPVVKHFPGHGDTIIDSHVGLPSVDYDMERLTSFEFVPFKEAIDNQADVVMVAHILLSKIDPEYPASLSKTVITDVLRDQLGFKGVIVTDDMTMGAIEKNYEVGKAAVRSVNAGSDIVLVCHEHEKRLAVLDALLKAAEDGTITEERVNESLYRILSLKSKYALSDSSIGTVNIKEINSRIKTVLEAAQNK